MAAIYIPNIADLAGWFDVTLYGATGDGVTDDTAAINAAIAAAFDAGGGTVYVPRGIYVLKGALNARTNSVITCALHACTSFIPMPLPIHIVGESLGWVNEDFSAMGGVVWDFRQAPAAAGTRPACVSFQPWVGSADYIADFNYVEPHVENILFITKANPDLSVLMFSHTVNAIIRDCKLISSTASGDVIEPTTTTSTAIYLPRANNNTRIVLDNVFIDGFYEGVRASEHSVFLYTFLHRCKIAVTFENGARPGWGWLAIEKCSRGINFTAAITVDLGVEYELSGAGKWYAPAAQIYDNSNVARGQIRYTGSGSTITVTGAAYLGLTDLAAAVLVSDTTAPTYSSSEIGTVNASTVAVTFSEAVSASSSDYATGVTINVNGSGATISSAARQTDQTKVYYVLSAPVSAGDTVTWAYSKSLGYITDLAGNLLHAVSAQTVTNNLVADTTAPEYDSGEIGAVNSTTVVVTLSENVMAAGDDYSAGVTIKVNGSGVTVSSGTRQTNHAVVYYVVTPAVVSGDTVTWEYSVSTGLITDEASNPLDDVTAQTITNNVTGVSTLVNDAFTDTNSVALASHTIAPTNTPETSWSMLEGAADIQGNKANISSAGTETIAVCDPGQADATVSAIVNIGNGENIGIVARCTNVTNFWLLAANNALNELQLYECTSGSYTKRASTAVTINASTDYLLELVMNGMSFSGTIDGGNTITYTSSVSQSATIAGLYAYNGTAFTYNDFKVTVP